MADPPNPSRVWLDREIAAFAQRLPAGGRVLDAGAGEQRYAGHFSSMRYESADFEKVEKTYGETTYVCDLSSIPVPARSFDGIVLSQVMEHLPEPRTVLQELHRILKPGGLLFYSGPLWYEEHLIPYDYFRYTQYGLRYLFTQSGFAVEELRWLEGYMGTITHQFRRMLGYLPRDPAEIGGGDEAQALIEAFTALKPLIHKIVGLAAQCDMTVRYTASGFPINYVAIVRKGVNGQTTA